MPKIIPIQLITCIQALPDPRRKNHNKTRHILEEVIILAILATICDADTWEDIAIFGQEQEAFLKQFLTLPNGTPSSDTFARIFALLDPNAFEKCFCAWMQQFALPPETVVSLDGKSNRRSHKKGERPLHIVNAHAGALKLTLGQRTVDGKTNEITAIPELLDMLFLKNCIITTDAMGCQGWITTKIKHHKADYVLAVKKNQGHLHADIEKTFSQETLLSDTIQTTEHAHGRDEVRVCTVTDDLSHIRNLEKWEGLQSIVQVTSTRTVEGETSTAVRYFISSLPPQASQTLSVVRAHWEVENGLHWSLDVSFREDESRVRIKHAGKNLAIVRKIALNAIRKNTSMKGGVKTKRFRASLNTKNLLAILGVVL